MTTGREPVLADGVPHPGHERAVVGDVVDAVQLVGGRTGHQDQAVTLPPLNMGLAKDLISRTHLFKLLAGSRRQAAADIDDICLALIQISQMVIDLPQIVTLEMNPVFADDKGVLALGARIWIQPATVSGPERLAIRPYPRELENAFGSRTESRSCCAPFVRKTPWLIWPSSTVCPRKTCDCVFRSGPEFRFERHAQVHPN